MKIFGYTIIISIELFYLWTNGALDSFIDQTILGAGEFTKVLFIPYSSLFYDQRILIKSLSLFVPLIILGVLIKGLIYYQSFEKRALVILISLYSLVNFSMVFPLTDHIHLLFAMPIFILNLSFIHDQKSVPVNNTVTKDYIIFVILVSFCILLISYFLKPPGDCFNKTVKHYEGIPFEKGIIENVVKIDNYLVQTEKNGNKAYLLDHKAALYLIPIDRFGFKSDTMLLGNFGTTGENEILQILFRSENIMVLVERNETNNKETKTFINYVNAKMRYVTSMENYYVYSK